MRIIGRLDDDSFQSQIRAQLEKERINLAGVTSAYGSSGAAIIVVANVRQNSIVVVESANAYLTPQYLDFIFEIIRSAGMVMIQLDIPTEGVEYLADIRCRFTVPLILDPAPTRNLSCCFLKKIKWFTPNETEASFLLGDLNEYSILIGPASIAKWLLSNGVSRVVPKMGECGACLATIEGLSDLPRHVSYVIQVALGSSKEPLHKSSISSSFR